MGITNSNKVINIDQIACDGNLRVTLALTAAPDILSNPTDIVLILDRSGSMAGRPLADMKEGAKAFIDLIDEATDRVRMVRSAQAAGSPLSVFPTLPRRTHS